MLALGAWHPGAAASMAGKEWELQAIAAGGQRRAVPHDLYAVIRFDGRGSVSGTACNHFGGPVAISGHLLRFGQMVSTAMDCRGPAAGIQRDLARLLAGSARWRVRDGTLHLGGGGVTAEFAVRRTPYPSHFPNVLVEDGGDLGRGQYQLGYRRSHGLVSLEWHGRAAPGLPWGRAGMAAAGAGVEGLAMRLDDQVFAFGHLPAAAERAEYRSAGRAPAPLRLFDLPDGLQAYGGFARGDGIVVAVGADGEVGRSRLFRTT